MKSIHLCACITLAAFGVALSSADDARADEVVLPGQEIRTTQTRPNRAMLSSGVLTLGVPYVASVVVAAGSDHPGDHDLYVPVAGPWMDLSDRRCPNGTACDDGLNKGLLVVNGIFQGIGALQILSAFLFPETVTVATTQIARQEQAAGAEVRVAPANVGNGYGFVAAGSF